MMGTLRRSLLAAACVTMLTAPAAWADVKIGFLGGFTGPIEALTPPIFEAAKLAVKNINDQGGVLDGQKIEMPSGDSTCVDATAAAAAGDRMVNAEKVVAIVGALCSGETIAIANSAAIPGGVMMISPASTSPALTTLEDNDLVFRTTPSDSFQGEAMAKMLKEKGYDNIAITYVNNDYGKGFADAVEAHFAALGGVVAAKEAHEEGKADYRAEIGQLASSGADTLVVLAYASGSGQTIIRQAIEGGDFARFVGGDGMITDELVTAIGADRLQDMIGTKAGKPEIPGAEVYSNLAKEAGLDPTSVYGPQAYDAAFLIALAIEKSGKAERDGLVQALREVTSGKGEAVMPGEWKKAKALLAEGKELHYEGAGGSMAFDPKGDVPGVIVEVMVKDGQFVEVGQIE